MTKLFQFCVPVLVTLLAAAQPVLAADPPPSEASIKKLMAVTEARKMIDAAMAQMDSIMDSSMQQALSGEQMNAEQKKILTDMQSGMVTLMKDMLSWEKMEPMFVDIYMKSLSQKEVDGMLAFYASEAGQAAIAKMPLIMQNTMQAMQAQVGEMMPKIRQLQQESIEKIKAAEGK